MIRIHAAQALGVAARCCRLIGPSQLDDELVRCRAELDRLDPETIERARAEAGELALRAAAALAVRTGSRSLLVGDHAQRLVREALFTLVYALRPDSRTAALRLLEGIGCGPMGLWQKISDTFLKRDVEVQTTDDGDDDFISTSPYPKPDVHGEPEAHGEEAGGGGGDG